MNKGMALDGQIHNKERMLNVNGRKWVMVVWMFMVKLFQFCYIFEDFHNKVLRVGYTISTNLKIILVRNFLSVFFNL